METVESKQMKAKSERPIILQILVATDLSPVAHAALDRALDLARRSGAAIELLTVLGVAESDAWSSVQYSPEVLERAEAAEEKVRKDVADLIAQHDTTGVRPEVSVRRGQPIPSIIARIEQINADLLVLGTHDRGRIEHLLVTSVAEELVRRAPCSALIVHERDTHPPDVIERILVPVDLSSRSLPLLRYAAALAEQYEARIDVLHAVEPVPLLDIVSGAMTMRDVVPDMRRLAESRLKSMLRRIDVGPQPPDVHVVEGHAASKVLDVARERRTDLIVIGKQGRSAIERFFIGSVTERVVRHAPCPVLVARVEPLDEEEV